MGKVMTFTGPRPTKLFGYGSHELYQPLFNTLKEAVRRAYKDGYDTFITGGAQGVDQLAFWAVYAVKLEGASISNIVFVPMEGQASRWARSGGPFSQEEYNKMLYYADRVEVLNPKACNNREAGFYLNQRNERMLDAADSVTVVLGPGITEEQLRNMSRSGTANCYRSALKREMQVRFVQA